MDRHQLFYAILNLMHPKGYRNERGLRSAKKLLGKTDADLWRLYNKLKNKSMSQVG